MQSISEIKTLGVYIYIYICIGREVMAYIRCMSDGFSEFLEMSDWDRSCVHIYTTTPLIRKFDIMFENI